MTPASLAAAGRIFRYVVRVDRGGSPNPFHGWCSLAVCKPKIRRSAHVGDWIVGLRSRANDQVVFAMRVDEVPTLGDYWRAPSFRDKRPGGSGPPDNFYRAFASATHCTVPTSRRRTSADGTHWWPVDRSGLEPHG